MKRAHERSACTDDNAETDRQRRRRSTEDARRSRSSAAQRRRHDIGAAAAGGGARLRTRGRPPLQWRRTNARRRSLQRRRRGAPIGGARIAPPTCRGRVERRKFGAMVGALRDRLDAGRDAVGIARRDAAPPPGNRPIRRCASGYRHRRARPEKDRGDRSRVDGSDGQRTRNAGEGGDRAQRCTGRLPSPPRPARKGNDGWRVLARARR